MGTFFYNIIVYPLELIIEALFVLFYKAFRNYGLSIAAISVLVSLLSLPMYHIAEKIQQKERRQRQAMEEGVRRIRETFKGDERFMLLTTYYRQHGYHPLYALRSSVSLAIQVPFFIAAYHFLSNLPQLQGEGFLFINDLGKPDGLLRLGGLSINFLPVLMTLINVVAGVVYSKGFPIREKLQLYGMAGLFLILLYGSPAGLVYYWTLNNLFSLVKNIFYKLKRPLPVLYALCCLSVVGLAVALFKINSELAIRFKWVLYFGCIAVIGLPALLKPCSWLYRNSLGGFTEHGKSVGFLFISSILLIWALTGLYIPSSLIYSSPIEFSFLGDVMNPLEFVYNTALIMFGLWVVWPLLLFSMGSRQMKAVFAVVFSLLAVASVLNIFVFDGNYGNISRTLKFDVPYRLKPDWVLTVFPVAVSIAYGVVMVLILKAGRWKLPGNATFILFVATLALSLNYVVRIQTAFDRHSDNVAELGGINATSIEPVFSLSREGTNVVVLFLDRAISSFLPVIMEQFPELHEAYSGFVYYPNSVSFGETTLLCSPPLMGGYEYTPDEMNKRADQTLVDKHNEATLVLPRLFSNAGYQVNVFDPPYPNYKWAYDFSAFKPYPEIRVNALKGRYTLKYKVENLGSANSDLEYESKLIKRRLPVFSLLKIAFPICREIIYFGGNYFQVNLVSPGISGFLDSYATLNYLPKLTRIETNNTNNYIFMVNDATHDLAFLQAPEYIPATIVTDTYTPLDTSYNEESQIHYHANAASIKKIGEWLVFLKQSGVYDNTRIIIVSDHGRNITTPAFKDLGDQGRTYSSYNSLLLVKDFNGTGPLMVDNTFLTIADTPLVAIDGLSISPINPFTNKNMIDQVQKANVNIRIGPWQLESVEGKKQFQFYKDGNYTVHTTIFDQSNWTPMTR
jgi:YidC/Oxa1 family membrane protein insertase